MHEGVPCEYLHTLYIEIIVPFCKTSKNKILGKEFSLFKFPNVLNSLQIEVLSKHFSSLLKTPFFVTLQRHLIYSNFAGNGNKENHLPHSSSMQYVTNLKIYHLYTQYSKIFFLGGGFLNILNNEVFRSSCWFFCNFFNTSVTLLFHHCCKWYICVQARTSIT